MKTCDELRPLTAGRLLEIWRECRETTIDPLERTLLCNGRILAECCRFRGEPVYADGGDALADLTGRQIEKLLAALAEGGGHLELGSDLKQVENPAFDAERFDTMQKE